MADHCHNVPGLSVASTNKAITLNQYIGERQSDAHFIEALLSVAVMCTDHEDRISILDDVLVQAMATARALNRALDIVNLPEGGGE